eukprot:jgi/Orpsp1_1/1179321/evm.model.c7180000068877.1
MPSLTSSNSNFCTSSQQDKFLLKKTTDSSTLYNNKLNQSSLLSSDSVELSQKQNIHTYIHHHHHHCNHHNNHNHVRRLSTLDCHTLKNEIVKLNPKSS